MGSKASKFTSACNWILDHTIHIQSALIIISIIVSVLFSVFEKTNLLIISLVILLSGEFFIQSIGYLDTIKQQTSKTLDFLLTDKHSSVQYIQRYQSDIRSYMLLAKHDVFISGGTLGVLTGAYDLIEHWDSNISVRLLCLNHDNNSQMSEFCNMIGCLSPNSLRELGIGFKDVYRMMRGNSGFQVAVSDRVMPYVFVAVDIDEITENSFIKVQQYLYGYRPGSKTLTYIVKPDSHLFALFKDQIDIIWEARTPMTHISL